MPRLRAFQLALLLVAFLLQLSTPVTSAEAPSTSKKSVEVQFPHVSEALLEQLGYQKKNRYSSSAFKVTPRKPAPAFSNVNAVVNEKFEKVSLSDYRGKWLILFFYPFDFTFVCPTEIVSFSDSVGQFRSINAEVVAISTDSHHTHLAWVKTPRSEGGLGKMNIPLVADISKRISEDYGVLVTDEEDEMYGAALRGLFVIDPEGTIRSIQINDDAVGRSVDETLRILKAFQYSASHPHEVCPANWKPGGETIKTDHVEKMDFFQHLYGADDSKKQEL
ncbi:peroxiredoxin [Phytophthora pseudosyringae]|uniref:thioredoxin-dependent peroxiredoxin n=1 Tax=Phytophthora pseudosyringae TaxID=221518 RepID=A0A8T1W183_9STRA|nr:peroxiredoxin [Phytophthora pseudosyringae]